MGPGHLTATNDTPATNWQAFWSDLTITALLDDAIARFPDKPAIDAYRADGDAPTRITFRELGRRVERVAASLHALGVGRADVVAVQLPNWWEFVVTVHACARIGAVVNPLMPIFRERELGFMLALSEAKALVVLSVFRGFDHAAMAEALRLQLPRLRHVVVVDDDGANAFERPLDDGPVGAPAVPADHAIRPDALALLMFTSGTMGEPKGVMHCCKALLACTDSLAEGFQLSADDVLLCSTPMGHMAGYAALMLQAQRLAAPRGDAGAAGRLGAAPRRAHDGGRRRAPYRRVDAVPIGHLRCGERWRTSTRAASYLSFRWGADSSGADRTRGTRPGLVGVVAVRHDRHAGQHADRA